ncbi:MAG: class I SAM-dependent methyltransferase [Alphaproteobacteria bacterium]
MNPFFQLHSGIPREGPGSDASTRRAIGALPPLSEAPRILDVGCGPGKQTLVLARALGGRIDAIDLHEPFLERLRRAAADAGLGHLVTTRRLSMDALDYPLESFDLIWSEGAAYVMGVGNALRAWRPILRTGGCLAFTEPTWLTDAPPAEAAEIFSDYPGMTDVDGNLERADRAGYDVLAHFTLPPEDWWAEYYGPLERRIAELRPTCAPGSELARVLDTEEHEIAVRRRHGASYGYVFFVLRRRAGGAHDR